MIKMVLLKIKFYSLLFVILLFFCPCINAQGLDTVDKAYTTHEKEKIMQTKMVLKNLSNKSLLPKKNDRTDISVDYELVEKNNKYKIIVSLYPWQYFTAYTDKAKGIDETALQGIFITLYLNNILYSDDYGKAKLRTIDYKKGLIESIFKSDTCISVFFENNQDFEKNYKYCQLFYNVKKGTGTMCVLFLANEISVFQNIQPSDIQIVTF
jgi:hypothetical protein